MTIESKEERIQKLEEVRSGAIEDFNYYSKRKLDIQNEIIDKKI